MKIGTRRLAFYSIKWAGAADKAVDEDGGLGPGPRDLDFLL